MNLYKTKNGQCCEACVSDLMREHRFCLNDECACHGSKKTPTQQFIEDCNAGGFYLKSPTEHEDWLSFYMALSNPLAWQAVGKTRGWKAVYVADEEDLENDTATYEEPTRHYTHSFVDHLADGKTIDEALAAISQGV